MITPRFQTASHLKTLLKPNTALILKTVACLGITLHLFTVPSLAQEATSPATPAAAANSPKIPWAKEVAAFEEKDKAQFPPKDAILFIGSSSIRIWNSLDTDFPGVPTINRGFGGSHISDSVILAPRLVWPYNPRAIVFYAGDNDLAAKKTPEQVFADYQAFVRVVREKVPTAPIAFISIKPSPSRAHLMPAIQQTNRMIAKWIASQPADAHLVYIDVWTAMTTPQNKPRPELFRTDMLHMNRQGYDIWTKIMTPFVKKVMSPFQAKAG